jgi:hypothetical protein
MMSATAAGWDRKGEWLVAIRTVLDPARAASASCAATGMTASCSVMTQVVGRPRQARLQRYHLDLAAHLRAAIRTGTACTYQPAQAVDWNLLATR